MQTWEKCLFCCFSRQLYVFISNIHLIDNVFQVNYILKSYPSILPTYPESIVLKSPIGVMKLYIYSSSINCCLIYFDNLLLGTFKIICSAFSCVKTEWWLPRSSRVRQKPTICFTLTFNNSFITGILIFSKSLVISNKVTLKFISNYDSMSTPLYPVLVHKHINYLKFSKLLD